MAQRIIIRRIAWPVSTALILAAMVWAAAAFPLAAQTEETYTITQAENILWFKANEERVERGLPPLVLADDASRLARRYSAVMAKAGKISHRDTQGRGPGYRLMEGSVLSTGYAENVAFHRSAPEAHAAFMGSPGHRANLLSPDHAEMGVGVVTDSQGDIYVTEVFFTRLPYDIAGSPAGFRCLVRELRTPAGLAELQWDTVLSDYLAEGAREKASQNSPRSLPIPTNLQGRFTATTTYSSTSLKPPLGTSKVLGHPDLTHMGANISIARRENMTHYYRVHLIVYQ